MVGRLRVIGGAWRGRLLQAPPGLETRPLLDRIRQSLFDRLGQRLDGWRCADACAGSGSFGIEAASRGAAEVHCCEPAAGAARCLDANLASLGRPPGLHLHRRSFAVVLPTLHDLDLVFCDPPFPWFSEDIDTVEQLLTLASAALGEDGLLLLRGERGHREPSGPWSSGERWDYGRSWVLAWRRSGPSPASGR